MPGDAEHNPKPDHAPRDRCAPAGQTDLVLHKDGQRFVFRCDAGDEGRLIEQFRVMAADPDHDLSWFDAAVLCHQIGRHLQRTSGDLPRAS